MTTEQKYPWQIDWESWKTLEVEATPQLIGIAKQLAARLHKSSGHKEASLYLEWAHKVGKPKVTKWWATHKVE